MILATIAFYFFAAICVASAVLVVTLRNPVHSVLFLILAFFNAAGLFVLLGAEFIAMTLVVVYVGAVAVLFLFVVMMLNIDKVGMKEGFQKYLPIGGIVCAILLAELILAGFGIRAAAGEAAGAASGAVVPPASTLTNTEQLGMVLYTDYFILFQSAGMILLVAMIGAITLTLRHHPRVKRQNVGDQVARDSKSTVRLVKVKSGEGVKP
ncbi:MAG: NADH-quinone oxidoreductase subunit J [Candidatus Pacebacteria bacterium]|nr:NADH-quinone oxidoreductase subunit J [Candidatus Paceibacterota bacterium]